MKKIKITESQKGMLEDKADARLKEDINYSQSGSKAVSDTFKRSGANKIGGMKVEGVEEADDVTMSELAPKVVDFIKQLYTKPSMEHIDPFWESIDVSWDELIQLLTELKLIKSVSGGYRLQKLDNVDGPTSVVRIVTKLVHKLINDKKAPVEEIREPVKKHLSNQLPTEPVRTGKTRMELLATIATKRKEELDRRAAEKTKSIGEAGGSNLPAGAQDDPAAPYNQVEPPRGQQPRQQVLDLEIYVEEDNIAFLTAKNGKLYVYNVSSADEDAYAPYASRTETPQGREDGVMNVEHGEWEIDEETINGYVNDNLKSLSTGKGLNDWESGVNLVEVDQELAQDLLIIADDIRNPNVAKAFIEALKSIGLDEMTSAGGGSSGSFVGKLGGGPITKNNVASEMTDIIGEVDDESSVKSDIVNTLKTYTNEKVSPMKWLSLEGKLKEIVDKIQSLNDEEWHTMIKLIIQTLQTAETHLKKKNGETLNSFNRHMVGLNNFISHFSNYIGEATTTSSAGGDSGTFAYDAPAGDGGKFWNAGNKMNKKMPLVKKSGVNEMVAREGKNAQTDTQWPDGHFVEFDDCTKYNNNKVAIKGGCSTGAVDNVVKTKSSKNSVISDSSIYEAIAEKTGKSVEEVKTIINRKNDKSE